MAEASWTREETDKFKNALQLFTAFCPTRLESIAEYVSKPMAHVKEHYEELVNDLLEMAKSGRVTFPDETSEAMAQFLYQREEVVWNKELHEWFLIGLKRFGKDWNKIAVLLESKDPMEVAIYAQNYFLWQKSGESTMKWSRANNLTTEETNVNVMKRPRNNDTIEVEAIMNETENVETLVHTDVSQPQQEPPVLDIGVNMIRPSTSS